MIQISLYLSMLERVIEFEKNHFMYAYAKSVCRSCAQDIYQDFLIEMLQSSDWLNLNEPELRAYCRKLILKKRDAWADFETVVLGDIEETETDIIEFSKEECLLIPLADLTFYERGILEMYLKTPNCKKIAKKTHISHVNLLATMREIKRKIGESVACLECLEK